MSFIPEDIIEATKSDIEKLDAFLNREESSSDSDSSLDDDEENVDTNEPQSLTPTNINVEFNDVTPYDQQVQEILSKLNTTTFSEETVLLLNTAQQNLLKEAINKYQKLLQNCDEQLNRIRIMKRELSMKARDNKYSSWFRCGIPYFKDKSMRHYCPPNKDVANKRKNGEISLIDVPQCRFWLAHEKILLTKVVCAQSKQIRLQMTRTDQIKNDEWRQKPAKECVFPIYDKNISIDWLKISIHDLKGRHTDDDCKAMWYSYLHPYLNNKRIGPREAKRLKEIAVKYNFQNWDLIAEELGTNRSGHFCCLFNRLNQGECNKDKMKWTSEEDNKLKSLIEKYKIGNFIPWGKLAYWFPNRDKSQIYNRYNISLRDELKKGKFSKQEDLMLISLAKKFNGDIKKICKFFKGRNLAQIRIRYASIVQNDKKINCPWTEDEDKQIIEYVKENMNKSISWTKLQEILNNPYRNRTNIRHRWNTIKNYLNSSFEGDLSSIPRPLKKRGSNINQTQIDNVLKVLNNDTIDNLNDITEKVLYTSTSIIDDPHNLIDQYQKFFIQKFHSIKFDQPLLELNEIDIVNIIILINILNGRINLYSLYHKRYRKCYTEMNEKKIATFIRDIVEKMNEKSNDLVFNYFKTIYSDVSFIESSNTIDLIIPKCFISIEQFDHMFSILKPFLKYVIWDDSELDQFYMKPRGRFERNIKFQMRFNDENSLIEFEKNIVHSATTKICDNFLDNSIIKTFKTTQITEIFKKRFLAIFNFKSMQTIVKQIVHISMNMKTEIMLPSSSDQKEKKSKVVKKGRPRKKLPGGRFKFELIENVQKNEDDDFESPSCSNQIKMEQNILLTKNIKEEFMLENDEIND